MNCAVRGARWVGGLRDANIPAAPCQRRASATLFNENDSSQSKAQRQSERSDRANRRHLARAAEVAAHRRQGQSGIAAVDRASLRLREISGVNQERRVRTSEAGADRGRLRGRLARTPRDAWPDPNQRIGLATLQRGHTVSAEEKQTQVKVAVVQAGAVPFASEACVDKAVRLIGDAAAAGARVIVFPEAFIGGYPKGLNYGLVVGARDAAGREEFRLYLAAAIDVPGPQTARLAEAAAAHKSYVVIGAIERERGTCYCTVIFFAPDGRLLGKHRKLMPTAME